MTLAQSPFTAPLVERSTASAARAIDQAMAGTVTQAWLNPRVEAALAADDIDALESHVVLAARYAISLSPEQLAEVEALRARHAGWVRVGADCAACAIDIASCATLTLMAACAIPLELTPVGDINALRRAAVDAATGEEVDALEVGLALTGLGASALVLASGGSSLTIKGGATLLRVGRRMGTVTAPFLRTLHDAADLPIRWRQVPAWPGGTLPLSAVTDTARLSRLGAIAGDLGRVRANTSTAEALMLLRHVDDAEDAARLARLSDLAGGETRRVVETLGKARAFRLTLRVANIAIAAWALIYALLVQVAIILASRAGRGLLRLLR